MQTRFRALAATVSNGPLLAKALKVGAVVGTVLNQINQGDRIMTLAFAEINWLSLILTYLVPVLVSLYSAVSMREDSTRHW